MSITLPVSGWGGCLFVILVSGSKVGSYLAINTWNTALSGCINFPWSLESHLGWDSRLVSFVTSSANSLITWTCFLACNAGQVTTGRQWCSKCRLKVIYGKGPGIYWLPSECLVCLSVIPFLTVCCRSVANKQIGKQQHSLAGGDLLSHSTCKTALSLPGTGTPGISFFSSWIL